MVIVDVTFDHILRLLGLNFEIDRWMRRCTNKGLHIMYSICQEVLREYPRDFQILFLSTYIYLSQSDGG